MKTYLTTAIDYVNSVPHIGTAYEKIGADVLARFYRMQGQDVVLQMGNDEHSANVQKSAIAKGQTPKVYCDSMRPQFEDAWKSLHIQVTQFIQTSEPRHHAAVKAFFEKVYAKGDIYPREYEGWYCESCEAFYTEKDLTDELCPNHKTKPKWLKEQNYFFKLSNYADFLLKHYEDNPDFIVPAKRKNEIVSFIKQGLEDISISRSTFDWGIPLPINPKHVMYVWFDALINYITGAGFNEKGEYDKNLWPATIHIVGKDITRFHAIIWPAMLQSAGLPLPKMILGHGFVSLRGEKMSKSLGNVVTPLDITKAYPEFGADALRYYLMRTSSFGDDSDFTWDDFIQRYNAELANGVGNLVSRVWGMVWKYHNGQVKVTQLPSEELELLSQAEAVANDLKKFLDPFVAKDMSTHFAIERVQAFVTLVDGYVDRQQPWSLAKDPANADKLQIVMWTLVEAVRLVTMALSPFIPHAAQKIWSCYRFDQLQSLANITFAEFSKTKIPFLKSDHQLSSEKPMIFPRMESKLASVEASAGEASKAEGGEVAKATGGRVGPPQQGFEGVIDISDFAKVDLRVAKILSAEKVENADKLLKLQVQIGEEQRQIVAGIAAFYKPEDLIGKSVVVVANLKPAKIRGIESRGMLLAAKDGQNLFVISPTGEIVSGVKVG